MSSVRRRSWFREPTSIAALAVVAAVVVLGVVTLSGDDAPQTADPGVDDPITPGGGEVAGAVRFERAGEVVPGPMVTVVVDAPAGATEMQVGTDPTFASVAWTAVAAEIDVPMHATGYQSVFARFRAGPDEPPTSVSVAGIEVDPTYAAATSGVDGDKQASWVRPIAPDAVIVRIEGGRLEYGVAPDDDRLVGAPVDGEVLDRPEWRLTLPDGASVTPTTVDRRTSAAGVGRGSGDDQILPVIHDVVLQFDTAIPRDVDLVIDAPDGAVASTTFRIDALRTESPVVHVNQAGFGPGDPAKVATLSAHLTGVAADAYGEGLDFVVVDTATDSEAFRGATRRRVVPDDGEMGRGDLTGAPVFEMDFSDLDEVGRYRVCVDGIGCSTAFDIDDRTWTDLAVTVSRAMYHQRSGVALGAPFTSVSRPRPYHPDDGLVVRQSELTVLETKLESTDTFRDLQARATDTVVDVAWGGHFDAGDWDRRIDHLWYVRSVAELVGSFPETFGALDLDIPESGDDVPDLLDEGLWTLDLFVRMQRDDGAVPGGIEAAEHPEDDSTSWTEELDVFAFAPDPWASYIHASVAAEVARVLRPYDDARAREYEESAVAAFEWAASQPADGGLGDEETTDRIRAQRGVAAAALLALTGDSTYHDAFTETTPFADEVVPSLSCHTRELCDAAWLYLTADEGSTDPTVRSNVEASIVESADRSADAAATTAFGWALENPDVPLVWGLGPGGSSGVTGLLRAHQLTGDQRYLEAAIRSVSVSLGANPSNQVFFTGIGTNPVRHPLIVDVIDGGLPNWAGTPVYGYHSLNATSDDSWVEQFFLDPAGATPSTEDAPYLWQYQDMSNVAMFNEFTVAQSHGAAIYAFGVLAGLTSS